MAHAQARLRAEAAVLRKVPLAWLRFGPGRDRGPDAPGWTRAVGDAPMEVRSAAEVLLTQALAQLGLVPVTAAIPLTAALSQGERETNAPRGIEEGGSERQGDEAGGGEAGDG